MAADQGSVEIEGFKELAEALRALGKTAGKSVLRRVGKKRLEPMRIAAEAKAPKLSGRLKKAIKVSTSLARSQKAANGPGAAPKDYVQVYMGPGQEPQAITSEFGTFQQEPQPYMRPAFDAEAERAVTGIGQDLWDDINKVASRAAAKAARKAAKGGA